MLSKNEVEKSSTKGPEILFVETFENVVDPPCGDGTPSGLKALVGKSFERIGGPIDCKESELGETLFIVGEFKPSEGFGLHESFKEDELEASAMFLLSYGSEAADNISRKCG